MKRLLFIILILIFPCIVFGGPNYSGGGTPSADSILEAMLQATNAPTDNYILSYDLATGGFTWVSVGVGSGDLLADGTVPLTANWDVGAFSITGLTFISDVATGTAPFTVASTTAVSNLNADLLDGNEASAFQSAISFGTGVETALGVNIGSAGAPVLFNGAGGTPSSITLTNGTGLPYTSITGMAANVPAWLASSSLANLNNALGVTLAVAPTNVTPVDTADEDATFYPILVDGATGSQATETDNELSYNPSTDTLTVPNISSSGGVTTPGTTSGPQAVSFKENTGNGSDEVGIGAPPAITTSTFYDLPGTAPVAGQIFVTGTPAAETKSDGNSKSTSQLSLKQQYGAPTAITDDFDNIDVTAHANLYGGSFWGTAAGNLAHTDTIGVEENFFAVATTADAMTMTINASDTILLCDEDGCASCAQGTGITFDAEGSAMSVEYAGANAINIFGNGLTCTP